MSINIKNAKILILNAGFKYSFSGGKLSKTLVDEMKSYLEGKGHTVQITNMDDGYNDEEELKKIMWSDVVILETPAWWFGIPWGAKKYIDTVFAQGVMYENDGRTRKDPSKKYGTGGLCHGKYFVISSTWNAPEESFIGEDQFFKGKGIEGIWFPVHLAFESCAFKILPPVTFFDVMKNPQVEKFIADLHAHLDKYF